MPWLSQIREFIHATLLPGLESFPRFSLTACAIRMIRSCFGSTFALTRHRYVYIFYSMKEHRSISSTSGKSSLAKLSLELHDASFLIGWQSIDLFRRKLQHLHEQSLLLFWQILPCKCCCWIVGCLRLTAVTWLCVRSGRRT